MAIINSDVKVLKMQQKSVSQHFDKLCQYQFLSQVDDRTIIPMTMTVLDLDRVMSYCSLILVRFSGLNAFKCGTDS